MSRVSILFAQGRNYEFQVDALHPDRTASRTWLFEEYQRLECEPRGRVGKILILDVILDVAETSGEAHFQNRDEWATTFALHVATVLERPNITVNIPDLKVG